MSRQQTAGSSKPAEYPQPAQQQQAGGGTTQQQGGATTPVFTDWASI